MSDYEFMDWYRTLWTDEVLATVVFLAMVVIGLIVWFTDGPDHD